MNFDEYFSQVGVKTYELVSKNYPLNEVNLNPIWSDVQGGPKVTES